MLINKSIHQPTVHQVTEDNTQGQELQDATKDTWACCTNQGLRDDQDMVVGIAFTAPFEAKEFTLFPFVFQVDATADTKKITFPLVTNAKKDSYRKMFIILWAFLPNEKS